MIDDVIVIDDAISPAYQDFVEKSIMESTDFPWYFNPGISKNPTGILSYTNDSYGWAHVFYQSKPISFISGQLFPIVQEACHKINFYVSEFYQGRVFQTVPRDPSQIKDSPWHIDMYEKHLVCLYYVNDSTGPTIISNRKAIPGATPQFYDDDSLNILRTVDPKKGRAVLFDGRYYHRATNPESGRRVVINFNVGIKKA